MRALLIFAVAAAGCHAPVVVRAPAPDPTALSPGDAALLDWAARALQIPDPRRAPYVVVHSGWDGSGRRGFLLRSGERDFEVEHDGRAVSYSRGVDDDPGSRWEAIDLDEEILRRAQDPLGDADQVELACVARAAGRTADARRLVDGLAERAHSHDAAVAVRGAVADRLYRAALEDWDQARVLAPADFVARLRAVAAAAPGTRAGAEALRVAVAVASASEEPPPPADALEAHVAAAITALVRERCRESYWSWSDWPDDTSAIGRLRQLGYDAVPALLALAEDDRSTFCVSADELVPRRKRALDALGQIAHRKLDSPAAVRDWWRQAQRCTEPEHEGGGHDLVARSKEQLERGGGPAAIAATIALARRAHGWLRFGLVRLLAETSGAAQVDFLVEEAAGGPVAEARLEAAQGLARRRRPGVAPSIVDLLSPAPSGCSRETLTREVIDLLVALDEPAGLAAVERQAARGRPMERFAAVLALGTARARCHHCAAFADRVLDAALEDRERLDGLSVTIGGRHCASPRVADVAALALAARLRLTVGCELSDDAAIELRHKLHARAE